MKINFISAELNVQSVRFYTVCASLCFIGALVMLVVTFNKTMDTQSWHPIKNPFPLLVVLTAYYGVTCWKKIKKHKQQFVREVYSWLFLHPHNTNDPISTIFAAHFELETPLTKHSLTSVSHYIDNAPQPELYRSLKDLVALENKKNTYQEKQFKAVKRNAREHRTSPIRTSISPYSYYTSGRSKADPDKVCVAIYRANIKIADIEAPEPVFQHVKSYIDTQVNTIHNPFNDRYNVHNTPGTMNSQISSS